MNILIVDDNADDRRLLRYLVEQHGHHALEAQHGLEGLEQARASRPDLIISDALMPGMDGFQFLRALRQEPALQKIPFVFYSSSYREDQDVRLALSLGADAYLVKPLEPVELWQRMEQLLQAGRPDPGVTPDLLEEDAEYLRRYSAVVAAKLEDKVRELQQTLEEQKRAEAEVALLSGALNKVREAAYLIDASGRFQFVNEEACRVLGYTRTELLERRVEEIDPDYAEPRWTLHWAALKTQGALLFESRHQTKAGRLFPVEISANYLEYQGQAYNLALARDITERKHTEESLRQANETLRATVDAAPTAIIDLDTDGRVRSLWNAAAERMLGWRREEVLGRVLPSVPEQATAEFAAFRQAMREGKSILGKDLVRQRKDGSRVEYSLYAAPMYDPAGLPVGNVAVLLDISERKRAEADLQESEDRYRKLIAASPDAITTVDVTGRITLASAKAIEMFRISSEAQALGRNVLDWVAPEQQPAAQEELRKLLTTGVQPRRDFVLKRGDGTTFEAEVNAAPIHSVDGVITGVILITRDVTERNRAAESLRKLSRAVEQSPASIVITDLSGAIEYVNPKFTQVTGYAPAEVLGRNPRLLKSGERPPEDYQELWRTVTSGKEWRGEFHNRRKNGQLYWELASISPIVDAEGRITHFLAVKEDITERRRLEEEYRQAQRLEAVGRLAGGVAHDFNNILTAILMNLSLLKEDAQLSADMVDGLTELEREAKRAANLTRQLLLFSRRQVLEARPLDLTEIVNNMTKMLRRLIGEDIDLSLHGPSQGLWTLADAGMMEQVLMNLCVNARDAMPNGGRLTIGTQLQTVTPDRARDLAGAYPGPFICLSVADSGCGMDTEIQKHIFEPFFTTKEVGQGTGLGLATVHGIVNQHHGWVEVDSTPGLGTTFRVFLPALSGRPPAPANLGQEPVRGGAETLLVVEDSPELRRLVTLSLRKLGYAVLEAATGLEALQLWEQHQNRIDLVFTDMVMPGGLTGLDLTERLRKQKPALHALITTGYTAEKARRDLLSAKGIAYLAKPYEIAALAKAVRACLDAPARPPEDRP